MERNTIKSNIMKRFQECNRIVKIWRYRWYLLIPFKFLYHYKKCSYNVKVLWNILISDAQIRMEWYHTNDEVKSHFKELFTIFEKVDDRKGKINKIFKNE